jgi:DNA-binding NarL/FixJ family response regulator
MNDSKKKLLLIDDNEIIRIMFSNLFWLHGLDEKYDLTVIGRLEDAAPLIENPSTRPDIIFTGLVMPFTKDGKTTTSPEAGFSLLKQIKSSSETKNISVVIFSSYDEKEYQKRALELGAKMYLKKSDNMPQDLIDTITNLEEK